MPAAAGSPKASVSGISGYGNAVGVPTVGGETVFDATYAGNPLGQRAVSRAAARRPARAGPGLRRRQPGRAARVVDGSRRHRRRRRCWPRPASPTTTPTRPSGPSVQVGDPFEEKRLIEACLDALRRRAGGRHPGSRRRRPHLRHQRDGEPGRGRAWTSYLSEVPAPRAGHGAVRGDDQRVPGADAGDRRARRPRRGAGHLRPLGGAGHAWWER